MATPLSSETSQPTRIRLGRSLSSPSLRQNATTKDSSGADLDAPALYDLRRVGRRTFGSPRIMPSSMLVKSSLAILLSVVLTVVISAFCRSVSGKRRTAGAVGRRLVGKDDRSVTHSDAALGEILDMCLDMEETWGINLEWIEPEHPFPHEADDYSLETKAKIARIERALKASPSSKEASLEASMAALAHSSQPPSDAQANYRGALSASAAASLATSPSYVGQEHERSMKSHGSDTTTKTDEIRQQHYKHQKKEEIERPCHLKGSSLVSSAMETISKAPTGHHQALFHYSIDRAPSLKSEVPDDFQGRTDIHDVRTLDVPIALSGANNARRSLRILAHNFRQPTSTVFEQPAFPRRSKAKRSRSRKLKEWKRIRLEAALSEAAKELSDMQLMPLHEPFWDAATSKDSTGGPESEDAEPQKQQQTNERK